MAPVIEQDYLKKFIGDLQGYFDREADEIKSKELPKGYTPETRAMFLEFPEHLKACLTAIETVEAEARAELDAEKAGVDLSEEQIAKILESKKRAKLKDITRTVFVVACASNVKMAKCLAFAKEFDVQDLSSFDQNTGLSPLSAAMLRRGKAKIAVKAMKELEKAGADIHMLSSPQKNNIAHMAALFGVDKKIIDYLVGQKVNFNQKNKSGFTALDMAVGRRDAKFLQYLILAADAKFNFTPKRIQDASLADAGLEAEVRKRISARRGGAKDIALTEDEKEKSVAAKVATKDSGVLKSGDQDASLLAAALLMDRERSAKKSLQQVSQQQLSTAAESNDGAISQRARQNEADVGEKSLRDQINRDQQRAREEERRAREREVELRLIEAAELAKAREAARAAEEGPDLIEQFLEGAARFAHAIEATAQFVTYVVKGEFREVKNIIEEELGMEGAEGEAPEVRGDGAWIDLLRDQKAREAVEATEIESAKKVAPKPASELRQSSPPASASPSASPSPKESSAAFGDAKKDTQKDIKFTDTINSRPTIGDTIKGIVNRDPVAKPKEGAISR